MRKLIIFILLLAVQSAVKGQTGYELLYWFDNDNKQATTISQTGEYCIDVSHLENGIHSLHVQVKDSSGLLSQHVTRNFLSMLKQKQELKYIYWFNKNDKEKVIETSLQHRLKENIDVSALTEGFHEINIQVTDEHNSMSAHQARHFLKVPTQDKETELLYWFDNDSTVMNNGPLSNGLLWIDVSKLNDGLHQLSYMLIGDNGIKAEARVAFFVKTPLGGNAITSYEYWLNDCDSVMSVKKFDTPVNPMKLITLMPVESIPLRSSSFHFEVKDGKPMIYAKNTLNMRFFDKSARFTDFSRDYIDYNVSQKVTDITPIARDEKSKVFDAPGENEIKWFSFEAFEGDTLAYKSSQATSIQLFSPSGKEIFTTNGAESTRMSGCHTWENGKHYLAVHDVTGSNNNMILDILHMDKYDIVDQDVRNVGDEGASTITYKGNGFKALCEVRFINSQSDTIVAEYIERTSDAEVGIIADFNTTAHGDYDAMFIFSGDEYKIVKNSVTVEEATEINLETEVKFASSFLRGTANTYSINITNTGNMTAYYVPLELKLITSSFDNIISVDFGNELISITNYNNYKHIDFGDEEEKNEVFKIINKANDIIQFIVLRDSIEQCDYGVANFFISIPPKTTKNYKINILSSETIEFYAYTSKAWFPMTNKVRPLKSKSKKSNISKNMCCYKEKITCVADLIGYIPALGCGASFLTTAFSMAIETYCSEGNTAGEKWSNYIEANKNSLISSVIENAIGCVVGKYASRLKDLKDSRELAFKMGSSTEVKYYNNLIRQCQKAREAELNLIVAGAVETIISDDCQKAIKERIPNCPPDPDGGGGKSNPVTSFDPNDIIGFTAESGSKYVPSNFENTFYTIRCENDPEFATAAAHTVVVTDTLDGNKLDLSTFAARSVKIGDKVMELNGEKTFVKTMDLRTEIDVIAEVSLDFDKQTGIAVWTIKSLDPMTMESTDDPMQGVLPVNNGGNGEAEFSFDIKLKQGLANGEKIDNIASIVFDSENAIQTPVWSNIIDDIKPVSAITGIEEVSDSTIRVTWEGSDEGSGIYRYQLYVQAGEDAEWKPLLGDTLKTSSKLKYSRDIDFGFCVLATDSAGNVEAKELAREFEFGRSYIPGDADKSGNVDILDINATLNHILGYEVTGCDILQMDSYSDGKIDLLDINATLEIILNGSTASQSSERRKSNVIRILNKPTL